MAKDAFFANRTLSRLHATGVIAPIGAGANEETDAEFAYWNPGPPLDSLLGTDVGIKGLWPVVPPAINIWGNYQGTHVYGRYTWTPTLNSPVNVWYQDVPGNYGDNSGTLTLEIGEKLPFGDAPPAVTGNPQPAAAANATVIIVTGNAEERTRWSNEARDHYGAGAYIYNDISNAQQLADRIAEFANGSIHKLVIGGHGTNSGHVGVQPTNNDTYAPAGADQINDREDSITNDIAAVISARIANDGWVEIQSCGGNEDARIGPMGAAQALANRLHRKLWFAVGTVGTWDVLRAGPKQPIPNPYWAFKVPA